MRDSIEVTGMVLKVSAVAESDRRVVILTRERGKITAFAHGAKRPGNSLMAASQPFAFGNFTLIPGREAYTLQSAVISRYFNEISEDVETACYGSYFLELADYYSYEGMPCDEMLLLLYQSLRALTKPSIPNTLVQLIFELRLMVINGEYMEEPPGSAGESARYAWEFIVSSPLEHLYTFVLSDEAQKELEANVDMLKKRFMDRKFNSLEILKEMQGN